MELVISLMALLAQAPLGQPVYSGASIANAAAHVSGWYAPNTFVAIYGKNLSRVTQGISPADIRGGELPHVLLDSGVRVYLDAIPAGVFFVSPEQVNILVPAHLTPSTVTLRVTRDSLAGPPIDIRLERSAPALFEQDGRVIATHLDGSLVTEAAPAQRGEVIVLWATGLGPVVRPADPYRIPMQPSPVADFDRFYVLFDGAPVPRDRLFYAGVAPGFAGLYQINLRVPESSPADPEIRVGTPDRLSLPGRRLTLR